ncbi:13729_t:CDS:2, partial [Acaulospora morrowiae]
MIKRGGSKLPSQKNETSHSYYRDGLTAFKENDFKKALTLFNKAITLNPGNIQLHDCRAATCEKLGQLNEARQDAETMLRLDKSSAKGYLRAGKLYRLLNLHDKAREIYKLGITNVPENDPLYEALCRLKGEGHKKPQKSNPTKIYDPLMFFPNELIHEIFMSLPFATVCKATLVSKRWRKYIISSGLLHRSLDFTVKQSVKITDKIIRTYIDRGKSKIKQVICPCSQKLTDATLKYLRTVFGIRLQKIVLTYNSSITNDAIVPLIRTIGSHLKHINLSGTNIMNKGVEVILSICSRLEILDLEHCSRITAQAFNPEKIQCRASGIREINLNYSPMTEIAISFMVTLFPKLTCLGIRQIIGLSTETLKEFPNFPDLNSLSLEGCIFSGELQSMDRAFVSLASSCLPLREFSFEQCPSLTDNCVRCLVTSFNLEVLELNGNNLLTDETMYNIGVYCSRLKVLRIGKSPGITDHGVLSLFNNSSGEHPLEIIDLRQNSNISNVSLEKIADHCCNLREINVQWCSEITGSGVAYLVKKCKRTLKNLYMEECSKVSLDAANFAQEMIGLHGGRQKDELVVKKSDKRKKDLISKNKKNVPPAK